ncbi:MULTISPECIES: hypothetical protein [unclassified Coleofasciculus]|uniref:hypothetical protein n=1 Tax=unclassified Coleofasciculus TaxID=2692782 RepID=UPI00188093DE|nr:MULTISPECIES: hypothetical protein [unclassified Coleofasciculus]MBE9124759.1 hypothetical protein [Coleofasciculus sp. LEGE 07081]MBE9148211.1 hypothetical protein [Coleofasciculus sp. LEGE 07092]
MWKLIQGAIALQGDGRSLSPESTTVVKSPVGLKRKISWGHRDNLARSQQIWASFP